MPRLKISALDRFLARLNAVSSMTVTNVEIGNFGSHTEPGSVINFMVSCGPNTTLDFTCRAVTVRGIVYLKVTPSNLIQATGVNFRTMSAERWYGVCSMLEREPAFAISPAVAEQYNGFCGLDTQQHLIAVRNELQRIGMGDA
jgi:hypothetical protein